MDCPSETTEREAGMFSAPGFGAARHAAAIFLSSLLLAIAGNAEEPRLLEQVVGRDAPVRHVSTDHASQPLLDLESLKAIARQNNPTLVQAHAEILASEAQAFQAGRYPNPTFGYASDQIGTEGTAGELQGLYFSQRFVTGGKLRLSQEKYAQRATIARTNAYAQEIRVLSAVRRHFFETLAAQEMVDVRTRLLHNAEDRLLTTQEMLNLGQANHADVLQAEVDSEQAQVELDVAHRELDREWQQLVNVAGVPTMPLNRLQAMGLADAIVPLDWHVLLCRLLDQSPELQAARQEVYHDQVAVERELVEPIPDIEVGVDTGYNFESERAVAGVTVGLELPVFNRNRGTINQVESDLMRSRAEVKRLELELSSRLSDQYQRYATAQDRVARYERVILPKLREAHQLLHRAYEARRGVWMDVLDAERRVLEMELALIHQRQIMRDAESLIDGMLLEDGLMRPESPLTGGHIDATPDPR